MLGFPTPVWIHFTSLLALKFNQESEPAVIMPNINGCEVAKTSAFITSFAILLNFC